MSLKQNSENSFLQQGLCSEFRSSSNIHAFHTFTPLRLLKIAGGAWMKSFSLSHSTKVS
jgi:hypothetical protein